MEIHLLSEKPDAIAQIAKWYSDEWGYLDNETITDARSATALKTKLTDYLNHDKIPLMLIATIDAKLIATAQLRYQENSDYPIDSHWLGGVYVCQTARNKGVAESLIQAILSKAKEFGVDELFLQTEDLTGGLYKKMGWFGVERSTFQGVEILIMKNKLER